MKKKCPVAKVKVSIEYLIPHLTLREKHVLPYAFTADG